MLRVETLDAATVRVDLHQGVASLRLRELLEGETFEIATANASITLSEPGEYRVEAQESDVTVLTVRGGVADVATADGPVRIASGQRVRLEGREAQASLEPPAAADHFDDWVLDREVRMAEAAPSYTALNASDSLRRTRSQRRVVRRLQLWPRVDAELHVRRLGPVRLRPVAAQRIWLELGQLHALGLLHLRLRPLGLPA